MQLTPAERVAESLVAVFATLPLLHAGTRRYRSRVITSRALSEFLRHKVRLYQYQ